MPRGWLKRILKFTKDIFLCMSCFNKSFSTIQVKLFFYIYWAHTQARTHARTHTLIYCPKQKFPSKQRQSVSLYLLGRSLGQIKTRSMSKYWGQRDTRVDIGSSSSLLLKFGSHLICSSVVLNGKPHDINHMNAESSHIFMGTVILLFKSIKNQ